MEKKITVALAGNPNSGKTTVFNNLTGARQHVGNWPGVTVEKKEGKCKHQDVDITVVDLPGTYSLTAYSMEEIIARDFVLNEQPDVVVDVVDASNLERNLYLATQFMELDANLVIALNMTDVAKSRSIKIDVQKLSELLGVPVIPMVATKNQGTKELLDAILKVTLNGRKQKPERSVHYGKEIEEELKKVEGELEGTQIADSYGKRWVALKLLENDEAIVEKVKAEGKKDALQTVERSVRHLEEIFGDDVESIIVDRRYGYISGAGTEVIHRTVAAEERHTRSDKIDMVLTNRLLGLPILFGLMWLTFWLTFKVGAYPMDWIDTGMGWLGENIGSLMPENSWYRSLIVDGIINGVGSVIVFLPNIFILFFGIAILEDSGYMARAAFIMDRVMHKLGLHGKSFIPMVMGFGCNVPAIMATRTLESRSDRLLTILINPLMSCSARLPIYTLLAAAFFSQHAGTVIFSVYLLGIILAILVGRLFRKVFFPGPAAPFVMELPPYRIPTLKGTLIHMWERGSMFLRKAGTIILIGVIVVWFLGTFPWGVEYGSEASYVGKLGHITEPIVKPFGADWHGGVALFFGFIAKEIVVGTFGTLYGAGENEAALSAKLQGVMTPLAAYAFMVFTLIYTPCLATVAVIKKETGSWKWTLFTVGYGLVLAWVLATLIFQVGKLFGLS